MATAFLIVSLVPIGLLIYIWWLDRQEREPWGLLIGIFCFSAFLGTTMAGLLETVGQAVLYVFLIGYIPIIGNLIYYFCVVGLSEEFCKRLSVMALAWKHRAHTHRFDCIVYCTASAIGFAVAENIMYVAIFGEGIAIGRLLPIHAICGIFMGYYLGCAKMRECEGNLVECNKYKWKSLLIPVAIHGAWDFLVTFEFLLTDLLALAGLVPLIIYAFILLHRCARYDAPLPFRGFFNFPPMQNMATGNAVQGGYYMAPAYRVAQNQETVRMPQPGQWDGNPPQQPPYGQAPQQPPYGQMPPQGQYQQPAQYGNELQTQVQPDGTVFNPGSRW